MPMSEGKKKGPAESILDTLTLSIILSSHNPWEKPFENINDGNQHFLVFPQYFLSYQSQIPIFESDLDHSRLVISIWRTFRYCCYCCVVKS